MRDGDKNDSLSETANGKISHAPDDWDFEATTIDRFGFLGGKQYTDWSKHDEIPVDIYRRREQKWIKMTGSEKLWCKYMSNNFSKIRERCYKGIPYSVRGRAWPCLLGVRYSFGDPVKLEQQFEKLKMMPCNTKDEEQIMKDIDRTYPDHEMFAGAKGMPSGQEDLKILLKCYANYNPTVGYCQGQAPLAAVLLMHMPVRDAFWCFVAVCDLYLNGYYDHDMKRLQVDGQILFRLLKKTSPRAYQLLKSQEIDPVLYMTEWFMCAFTRTLPWPTVVRILDIFFCEGVKVLFRIALVLIKSVLGNAGTVMECPSMYETLQRLRNIPAEFMEIDYLVNQMKKLPISDNDLNKENRRQRKFANYTTATNSRSAPRPTTRNAPNNNHAVVLSANHNNHSGNNYHLQSEADAAGATMPLQVVPRSNRTTARSSSSQGTDNLTTGPSDHHQPVVLIRGKLRNSFSRRS